MNLPFRQLDGPAFVTGNNQLQKFHVLTYVPEKTIKLETVDMEAEHCSDSVHLVVSKFDRIYAMTQNTSDRLP